MKRLCCVLAVMAFGCQDKRDVPNDFPTKPSATAAATVGTPSPSAAPKKGTKGRGGFGGPGGDKQPIPQGAITLPNVGQCVAECVDRNQMRAVSPEQIDSDCKAECKRACLKHCDTGSDDKLHGHLAPPFDATLHM